VQGISPAVTSERRAGKQTASATAAEPPAPRHRSDRGRELEPVEEEPEKDIKRELQEGDDLLIKIQSSRDEGPPGIDEDGQ